MEALKSVKQKISRVLSVRSARGVSFALGALSMASKPLGYARTLIIAWLFGTSPAMDAYHIANSIALFLTGCATGAVSGSILPEAERVRSTTGDVDGSREIVARATCFEIAVCIIIAVVFFIFPETLIRIFASGFDDDRIRIGAAMLFWIAPYSFVMVIRPTADIWAIFTERYTLASFTALAFNFISIPVILFAAPYIAEGAVPFSMSLGVVGTFAMFVFCLGGFPVRPSARALPPGSLRRISRTAAYSFALSCLGAMYMVIDKYFASLLPAGAVASISYGGTAIVVVTQLASTPMNYLLSRMSRVISTEPDDARSIAETTMALLSAYIMPACVCIAFCARSITELVYGWGSFGVESVLMTSSVIFAYSWGIVFQLMASVVTNFAIAGQRMRMVVLLSIVGAVINTGMNSLLVTRFGILGLAAATSVSQCVMFLISMKIIMGRSALRFAWSSRMHVQATAQIALGAVSFAAGAAGPIGQITISAAAAAIYLLGAERMRLFPMLPEHWRPIGLAKFLMSSVSSYAGKGQV